MDSSLLNEEICSHIKELFAAYLQELFSQTPTHDQEKLDSIYHEINNLVSTEKSLSLNLLAIAIEEGLDEKIRILALIMLKNTLKYITEDVLPVFLENCFGILEQIIQAPQTLFNKEVNALYCEVFKYYGELHYPDLYDVIIHLLEEPNTVSIGLQCLDDQVLKNNLPSAELVASLSTFVSEGYAEGDEAAVTFAIIYKLLIFKPEDYLECVCSVFIPAISSNAESYQQNTLPEVFAIIGIVYYHTQDEDLGNSLAEIIASHDFSELCEMFNFFSDKKHIPFNENIVEVLFNFLKDPDPVGEFGVCSNAMFCINLISTEYPEQAYEVLMPLISDCENDGQILRAISNMSANGEDPNAFVPIIMEHMEDEHRGEAVIAFLNICRAIPDVTPSVLDVVISLIDDDDGSVRDQVYFVLEELLPCANEKPEWFEALVNSYKSTEDSIRISQISQIIFRYLDGIQELNMELVTDLLQSVLQRYFVEEPNVNEARNNVFLLSQLIERINEPLSDSIVQIIAHAVFLMSNEQSDDIYRTFCSDFYEALAGLIDFFYKRYRDAIIEIDPFKEFLNAFTAKVTENKIMFSSQSAFSLIKDLYESQPQIVEQYGGFWATGMSQSIIFYIQSIPVFLISEIIDFWSAHIDDFNPEVTMAFTETMCRLYQYKINEIFSYSNILGFFGKLIEKLQQFGTLTEEIAQFFQGVSSQVSAIQAAVATQQAEQTQEEEE